MQKLYLSVFLPLWSVELAKLDILKEESGLGESNGKALLITSEKNGKEIVVRCCTKAKRLGVSHGMNLSNAKALTERFVCRKFDAEREAAMLESLARWANKFSPIVAVDKSNLDNKSAESKNTATDPRFSGLYLEVTGEEKLFGSYPKLVQTLSEELAQLGFCSRIALAPSYGGAWALARYGMKSLVVVDNKVSLRAALATLPTSYLRIARQTIKELVEVNIRRVEHLFNIPFSSLSARFSYDLINRLDEALGKKDEAFKAIETPQKELLRKTFAGPQKNLLSLTSAVEELSEKLIESLASREKKLSLLEITVKTEGQSPLSKQFPLSSGTLNKKHLKRITTPWLENLQMANGITEVALEAGRTELITAKNSFIFKRDAEGASGVQLKDLAELIDNLSYALGSRNIRELRCHESFLPERQQSFQKKVSNESSSQTNSNPPRPVLLRAERPSKLFDTPHPVKAMAVMPDNPPFSITWKNKTYKITNGLGPERISGEWWNYRGVIDGSTAKKLPERDYFKVQIPSGLWLWIYREVENSRWFIHGAWS